MDIQNKIPTGSYLIKSTSKKRPECLRIMGQIFRGAHIRVGLQEGT